VDVAELSSAAVYRPQGCDGRGDRGWGVALGGEPVNEPLQLRQRHFPQPLVAEDGQYPLTQVLLVAAQRGRFVWLA